MVAPSNRTYLIVVPSAVEVIAQEGPNICLLDWGAGGSIEIQLSEWWPNALSMGVIGVFYGEYDDLPLPTEADAAAAIVSQSMAQIALNVPMAGVFTVTSVMKTIGGTPWRCVEINTLAYGDPYILSLNSFEGRFYEVLPGGEVVVYGKKRVIYGPGCFGMLPMVTTEVTEESFAGWIDEQPVGSDWVDPRNA